MYDKKNMHRLNYVNLLLAVFIFGQVLTVVHAETLTAEKLTAEKLTIVSWGGAYAASQETAYFQPFTEQTGVEIEVLSYNGGIDELRAEVATGKGEWDLIDLVIADNIEACNAQLLIPIDSALLPPATDGTPASMDFLDGALIPCGVSQIVSATVLAFNDDAFNANKPDGIEDLFDLEQFPGKRGLQKKPIAILEWALLSYGVPIQDIYALLSTERGINLAFARLNKIKDHIVWWENGSEPAQLLGAGEVVMSSGYNGRIFAAAVDQKQPLEIIWQGQLLNYSTWGIPTTAPNSELAQQFVRFATDTQRLADQAGYIAYGPARHSSSQLVRKHLASGIDIRPHLPTYAANRKQAIVKDHKWYARTQHRVNALFDEWLRSQQVN